MELFLHIDKSAPGSLQAKLRERVSEAIARDVFDQGQPLPSTRALAASLGISRNTVMAVYQGLVSEGALSIRGRHGFFVAASTISRPNLPAPEPSAAGVDWQARLTQRFSDLRNPRIPRGWRDLKYKFVYGQHDRWIFPIADWRRCSRDSLSLHDMHDWTVDYVDADDPLLLDAFRRRVLPRRGFCADEAEILVTVGAQHALYLAAQSMVRPGTVVGIEEPSYADARNTFKLFGATLRPLPVDEEGLVVDARLAGCDVVYVTPNHQSPTTAIMSPARRRAFLDAARLHDFVVIEDDYDTEGQFGGNPRPALKSADRDGRVLYITSLSKLLSPGLRVGFLVGPRPLIEEIRVLRRLSIRHPPANNQRTIALFLKGGYYESLLKRFHQDYEHRWRTLKSALSRHMPEYVVAPSHGGSSLWVRAPDGIDTEHLARAAYARGVLIEPGARHFEGPERPTCFMRLGFSSIRAEDIEPGIILLAQVARQLASPQLVPA